MEAKSFERGVISCTANFFWAWKGNIAQQLRAWALLSDIPDLIQTLSLTRFLTLFRYEWRQNPPGRVMSKWDNRCEVLSTVPAQGKCSINGGYYCFSGFTPKVLNDKDQTASKHELGPLHRLPHTSKAALLARSCCPRVAVLRTGLRTCTWGALC